MQWCFNGMVFIDFKINNVPHTLISSLSRPAWISGKTIWSLKFRGNVLDSTFLEFKDLIRFLEFFFWICMWMIDFEMGFKWLLFYQVIFGEVKDGQLLSLRCVKGSGFDFLVSCLVLRTLICFILQNLYKLLFCNSSLR